MGAAKQFVLTVMVVNLTFLPLHDAWLAVHKLPDKHLLHAWHGAYGFVGIKSGAAIHA